MSATPWGVDLSPTYNPSVDASAIKAAGASYAILKVSEGVGWPGEDTSEFGWFARVAAAVLDAGLELRVYHLATPTDRQDALAEAVWFDRHLGKILPARIAYDLEGLNPHLSAAQHVDVFEAWSASVAGFLPTVPIELYCNRWVIGALDPHLPPETAVWQAYPGWLPGIALPWSNTVRVQVGNRTFPGVAGQVDLNLDVVDGAVSSDTTNQALGLAPVPAAPKPLTPQGNSDWSLTVRTLDLRNALNTPLRGDGVKALQTLLNLAGAGIAVDGVAGPRTFTALGNFQDRRGLDRDNIAGPQTWEALCKQ